MQLGCSWEEAKPSIVLPHDFSFAIRGFLLTLFASHFIPLPS